MDIEKLKQGALSSLATGGIGLGLNAVGSVIGDALSRGRMNKQASLEKSIMKYQQQLYDPSKQVDRLRRAGLNVGLMYSGNGMQSGGATGSIGMTSSDPQAVGMNPLMVSELKTAESVQAANLSKSNLDRVTALLREQETITEQNEHLQQALDRAKTDEERREIQSRIDLNNKRSTEIDANIKALQAQADRDSSQADLNRSLKLTEDTMRELDANFKRMNTSLTAQKIQESISQEFLNYENKNYLIEKQLTESEERDRIRADRDRLRKLSSKYQSEITAIESNTKLDAHRKAVMISEATANYGKTANDLIDNIRNIVKDSKANKGKPDNEINDIVNDFTEDVAIQALLDFAQ